MRLYTIKRPVILTALFLAVLILLSVVLGLFGDVQFYAHADDGRLPDAMLSETALAFESELPLMVLDISPYRLVRRAKPPVGQLRIYDNGTVNRLTDRPTVLFDYCEGYVRGQTSAGYPKKPYRLNLLDMEGKKLKYPLLGLDKASSWVLHSPYADKSQLRNYFAYKLGSEVLEFSPQCRLVELFLTDTDKPIEEKHYRGTYLLCDPVKAGKDRVNVGEFSLKHGHFDEEGGGYIVKRDKIKPGDPTFHVSPHTDYTLVHPSKEDITEEEFQFIVDEVTLIDNTIRKKGIYTGEEDWHDYIDVDSFIDFFLVLELLRSVDAGSISTFFYRQPGGKLKMGPLWDFDLSLGNTDYGDCWKSDGFCAIGRPWIHYLVEDEEFLAKYKARWEELRQGPMSNKNLMHILNTGRAELGEGEMRNARRWPQLFDGKTYIWPNPKPYTATPAAEFMRLQKFIVHRLQWLDENIPLLDFSH